MADELIEPDAIDDEASSEEITIDLQVLTNAIEFYINSRLHDNAQTAVAEQTQASGARDYQVEEPAASIPAVKLVPPPRTGVSELTPAVLKMDMSKTNPVPYWGDAASTAAGGPTLFMVNALRAYTTAGVIVAADETQGASDVLRWTADWVRFHA